MRNPQANLFHILTKAVEVSGGPATRETGWELVNTLPVLGSLL